MSVRFVWQSPLGEEDLDGVLPPGATVADLIAALPGAPEAAVVFIDGVATPAQQSVAESCFGEGSIVSLEPPPPRQSSVPVAEICTVGGLQAGVRWLLAPGVYRIGADPQCEIHWPGAGVEGQHVVIAVGPTGEGFLEVSGSSPVLVNGEERHGRSRLTDASLLQLGEATVWEFGPPRRSDDSEGRAPASGVFNRPPRTQNAPLRIEVAVPERPTEPTRHGRLGWATLLVPLAMGGVFAVLFSPMMAAFALLGPMMMLANWHEDRRRVKKGRRENSVEFDSALRRLDQDLRLAGAARTHALRADLPEAPQVVGRALAAGPRLWERRPQHRDFMQVSLGTADFPWEPDLIGRPDCDETVAVLSRHALLEDAPVGIQLVAGAVLGVAGSRDSTLALVRWVVTQLAVRHGPADVRVAIITDCSTTGIGQSGFRTRTLTRLRGGVCWRLLPTKSMSY